MKIVVNVPQIGAGVHAVVRAAQEAEEAGAWGVWVFDNLAPLAGDRPCLEGWSLLGPLARATSRVRLISLVTRAGLRPPALVARMAAVVADASDGRFVLGLGTGDATSRAEERRFGVRGPETRASRVALVRETVARLDDATVRPRVAPPPVWIGGRALALVDLAAEIADAWHGWDLDADAFALRVARAPVGFECWGGGMFEPRRAASETDLLAEAGAAGVTWMVRSTREDVDRPPLLRLVRDLA